MRHLVVVMLVLGVCLTGSGCGDNLPPPPRPDLTEVLCESLPAISSGTCEVTGTGTAMLLKGNVLTPAAMYRGGQVAVDATGMIACVGCDCAAADQVVVTCPDAAISPGLINTHDHITYTHNQPYADAGVRYEHRHQWREGQDGKPEVTYASNASADQIRWGELRFLMGGATSIVGSGGQAGLLRNLDSANQEGLGQGRVNFDTFPLDDISGARRNGDCNYGSGATTAASIANDDAYEPHTSEGIDVTARNEFLCQSSPTYDTIAPGVSNNLLLGKTAMIHAIGLQPADLGAMAAAGTGLIWSPRSNITLYGDTARVTTAARLGVEIALGTDWMPTGSMNLLRELRCADGLNQTYYGGFFTDQQLWQMVTLNAAAVTATDDVIGLLAPGRVADITVFAGHGKTYRAAIDAEPADVALVVRGGKVLYGDGVTVGAFAQDCDVVDVCGTEKRVCLMSEIGKTYAQLQTGAGAAIYPAFTCSAPPNEPSCTPKRPTSAAGSTIYTGEPTATDGDGDGIADAADKCPGVFDPIRPVDNAVQPDADDDGQGDACDACPLDAGTTTCTAVDPGDRDHDGVSNVGDNCPDQVNPDQLDGDGDGKGNVCDVCPADANAGAAGCPTTIYKIKNGTTALGAYVRVRDALVTGKGANGFFVQVKEGDAGYLGADYSGLMVFTGPGTPPLANATVGARVTIDGRVTSFQGQLELDNVVAVIVTAPGPEAPPAPIAATYAEIKSGGPRAAALEGVIVSLGASAVSAIDAAVGEFTVAAGADALVVDDFLFAASPAPQVCTPFGEVRGILAFRQMASKLELRGAGDLIAGAPTIQQLTPALSFARAGQTTNMPTFPAPLTVRLCGSAQGPTAVTITSGDMDALTVTDVTIPDGQTSGVINVTALAQSAAVTVTAALNGTMKTATVRVLGDAEAPSTVTLSPSAPTVRPAGTVQLTVTLDVPAPTGGTTVALSVNPPAAGTVQPMVTVAENQLSAAFPYTDTAGSGTSTVTATLGGSTSAATVTVVTGPDHLLISQVYGGGGNSGAPLTHDFIELHNPTSAAVSLAAGMSVQYASTSGTTWQVTPLPAGLTIPAGGYLLIQEAGGTTGAPLPAPDAMGTIAMAAANGKVALAMGTAALAGGCPTANVIDLVGYGTANCFEGTAAAPATSNTTAVLRAQNGCVDTDQNGSDFAAGPPAPRNSATAAAACN
jgi:cytosine/adenosine deaminase-related metal-dependent hydrolase